ncbi:hypothetical protein [Runella aurantiaca]|uniref:Uncharacterized protein n=1 Tax=Runella aurantiaca TaxID=2282308 RepID=A0A369IBA6_9BACT|nr:hypothetical protein [Runella aurantiaca]RDB06322.1 hypothetical protein DVG78_08645 [Runella aurantiaca]
MSLNEHTQFFGGPNEPAQKTPPLSPPNLPPQASTPPPAAMPPAPAAKPKVPKDYSKVAGALAIGAVAVGSIGFISWTVFEGDDTPVPVKPTVQPPIDSIVPELPKEEFIEPPVAVVEPPSLPPPPPPPAPKPSGGAPKPKPAPQPEPEPQPLPVVPDEIKIAEISDDSAFKDAFIEARDQVGPGGLFEYKGQWYSTYSIEEWNAMPQELQADFTTRIEPIINPVEVENEAPVVELQPDIVKLDTDNDGIEETTMADHNHDGLADVVIKDEPGEGISGFMYVDKNNDGKLETAIPVSDEGQVLEDKAETLENPWQVPMHPAAGTPASTVANSLSSLNEASEVVDLDTDGDGYAETALVNKDTDIQAEIALVDTDKNGKPDLALLDTDGNNTLETAVPIGLDGQPIMAQSEAYEKAPIIDIPGHEDAVETHLNYTSGYGAHDTPVVPDTDVSTDDLFTV